MSRTNSTKKLWKIIFIFLSLTAVCNDVISESSDIYIMKTQACKAGAEKVAPIAKAVQDSVVEIVKKTQPDTSDRKRAYKELIDMTEQYIDSVYEKIKTNKEELIQKSKSKNQNYDQVILDEIHYNLYYKLYLYSIEYGITIATSNATSNKIYSQSKYERIIEEECMSISPDAK